MKKALKTSEEKNRKPRDKLVFRKNGARRRKLQKTEMRKQQEKKIKQTVPYRKQM
jgi:hypothetical protein